MSKEQVTITISGPAGTGKDFIKQQINKCLKDLGLDVVDNDPDPIHITTLSKEQIVKGAFFGLNKKVYIKIDTNQTPRTMVAKEIPPPPEWPKHQSMFESDDKNVNV